MNQTALLAGSRYELLVKIATGGTATVYAGRVSGSLDFQRLVAIKRAHPHLRDDPKSRAMLVREARLASRVHHANVVAILDVEQSDDELLLIMDYIEGGTLAELLERAQERKRPLERGVAMRVLLDACAGLEAVHGLTDDGGRVLGMVHRDVSPQNILVGVDGTARLTDFGLAKLTEVSASSTAGMQGKIAYMAPEYVEGAPFTQRCDIFSLGVLVWETLTGKRLFKGSNEADTLRRVVGLQAPPISRVVRTLPAALDPVLARALAKDPAERYASVQQFVSAFTRGAAAMGSAPHAQVGRAVRDLVGDVLAQRRDVIRAVADPEQSNTASMVYTDVPGLERATPAPPPQRVPAETLPLTTSEDVTDEVDAHAPISAPEQETMELEAAVVDTGDYAEADEQPTLRRASASPPPPRDVRWLAWLPLGTALLAIAATAWWVASAREEAVRPSSSEPIPSEPIPSEPIPSESIPSEPIQSAPAVSAAPADTSLERVSPASSAAASATASAAPKPEPATSSTAPTRVSPPAVPTPRPAPPRPPPPKPPGLPKNPYKNRIEPR